MMRRNKEDKFPGKVTLVEQDVGWEDEGASVY